MRIIFIAPLIILLASAASSQEPNSFYENYTGPLEILSPLPDSSYNSSEPLEVSILLPEVDGLSISIFIDSLDITSQAELTSDYAFFLYPGPLASGRHRLLFLGIVEHDTIFSESWSFTITPTEEISDSISLPWTGCVGLTWQYGSCDRDTANLGLTYPTGHQPSASASFSGSLCSGSLQGDISYDRSYDTAPHGLILFSRRGLDLELGEFYPDISSLAFANAIPLGLLGKLKWHQLSLDFTACRTASADTLSNSFAQYLYGGRAGGSFGQNLWLGLGYLQGRDLPSSLPDSVRFRTTSLVVADTIFGLTDTLVYVDSLHPAKNRIAWLSLMKSLGQYSLELEAAGTRTDYKGEDAKDGRGFIVKIVRSQPPWTTNFSYSSTDSGFRSFGSPYLETNKNELTGEVQHEMSEGQQASLRGKVYKAFSDSAPGLAWSLGSNARMRLSQASYMSLTAEYSLRPYSTYLYQNRTLGTGLSFSAKGFRLVSNYSYTSSSSPGTIQSHSASADVSRPLYQRLLEASLGFQYYRSKDKAGTSDQEKSTATLSLSGSVAGPLSYRIQTSAINQNDRIDPSRSYRLAIASAGLSLQF